MLHAVELPPSLIAAQPLPVLLDYYTDPLCGQCEAFEEHWQRLRAEFGHLFTGRYRLGCPPHRGETCHDAWAASSYAAGVAVKCAERQGALAGERYRQALRAAARHHGRHAARPEMLAALAQALAVQLPTGFEAATFYQDMAAGAGAAAVRDDLRQAHAHHIHCFPAIHMQRGAGPGHMLAGYQSYEVLLQALAHIAPDLFWVPSLVEGGAG